MFQMILLTFYMIMNMRQMIHRKRKRKGKEEKWITWNNVLKTYCLNVLKTYCLTFFLYKI